MQYSEKLMEHFLNPRNVGEPEDANGVGQSGGGGCGDTVKLYVRVRNNVVEQAGFETVGCCSAVAASSVTTELICGRTTEQVLALEESEIVQALDGLPEGKEHCARLAREAAQAAVTAYWKQT